MSTPMKVLIAKGEEGSLPDMHIDSTIETVRDLKSRIGQENEWEISDYQLAFILDEEKKLAELGLHENTIINLAFSGDDDSWIKNKIDFNTCLGCASLISKGINEPCQLCGDVPVASIVTDDWLSGKCIVPLATMTDEGKVPLFADGTIIFKAVNGADDIVVSNAQNTANREAISTLYGYQRKYQLSPPKFFKLNVASAWDYAQKFIVVVEVQVDASDTHPFPKLRDELLRAKRTLGFPLPPLYSFWRLSPYTVLLEDEDTSLDNLGIVDGETILLCSSLSKCTITLIVKSELGQNQTLVEMKPGDKLSDLRKELIGLVDFGSPIEDCAFAMKSTGLQLKDDKRTLGSYHLKQGDTLLVSKKEDWSTKGPLARII